MNTHTRFIHQVIAIILSLAMIITLTLSAMGKVPYIVFWITAAVSLVVTLIFYKTPGK